MSDARPTMTRIPLDQDVVAILRSVLDMNRLIVESLVFPVRFADREATSEERP